MWLIYVLIILFIFIVFKPSKKADKFTGARGEKQINDVLRFLANLLGGMEFHDIMLWNNSITSQIDNILLTRKALYVIESKDYSGWIFGTDYQEYWKQTFAHYKSRRTGQTVSKFSFYNPIKQNIVHIRVLKKSILSLKNIPIYNIIVFGAEAELKEINNKTPNTVVTEIYNLNNLILNIDNSIIKEIDIEDQAEIVDEITSKNIIDEFIRSQHISRISEKYK